MNIESTLSRSPARRVARTVASGALMLLMSFILIELGLQVASLFAEDRTSVWQPGAENRILCVGDSHTWGASVSREESYPAQLQRFLDEAEPGMHSVVNQGLPGMNTAQLRKRLGIWLQRYRPDVVVVWVGVNNGWNRAEVEDPAGLGWARLDGVLSRLRAYRLVRVWLHDRELKRYVPKDRSERVWHRVAEKGVFGPRPRFTIRHDGVVEEIRHDREQSHVEREGEDLVEAQLQIQRDYEIMVTYARSAGVRLVFIAYPIRAHWFELANRAVRDTSRRYDIPLVETGLAVGRVPQEKQDWSADLHPGSNLYREIARDVAAVIIGGQDDPAPFSE